MVGHIAPDDWEDLLDVLAEEGEIRVDELDYDSESERERITRVLRQVEELGWVEESEEGVWTQGWKADVFSNPTSNETTAAQ